MVGVLHFMAVSTGPVLNYRTLGPPLGPVNFAARHRALPKNRHRDRRAPSCIECLEGVTGGKTLSEYMFSELLLTADIGACSRGPELAEIMHWPISFSSISIDHGI